MIECLIRFAALPIVIVLTILEWIGTCILYFGGMLCRLTAGVIFLLTITAYSLGLATTEQARIALVAGFIFFLFPKVVGLVVSGIVFANKALLDIVKR